MTRIPELQHALVAAGHRRYGRRRWRRSVGPVVAVAAMAVAIAIAIVVATASPERERERPAPSAEPDGGSLLPRGEPPTEGQMRSLERYGLKAPPGSVAIPAPPSSPDALGGDAPEWLILPRGDEICLQRGGAGLCGSRSGFAERGLIGSILPAPDEPLDLPQEGGAVLIAPREAVGRGPATLWGLVPPQFVRVVAIDAGVSVDVRHQAFELTVPAAEDLDVVRLFRADGSSIRVGGQP